MEKFLIHETGVHWIDTFRYLLGDPTHIYADLRQENPVIAGEDAGYFIFEFAGGARALFDGNRLLDHAAENSRLTMGEALLEGLGGTIRLTGSGQLILRRFGEATDRVIFETPTPDQFGGGCVFALQDHVLSGLQDGAPFENQAADYLRVMALEEALYRSNESGQRLDIAKTTQLER